MINQFLLFFEFVSSWMWFCWNDSLAAGMIFAGCGSAMLTANANANKPGSAFVNILCRGVQIYIAYTDGLYKSDRMFNNAKKRCQKDSIMG